jgi:hypothetical protein
MTPDKWQAIERLYLASLERDTAERADFLRSASAGDDELRREVEALLEYQPKVETFLNSAAAIDDGAMPGTSDLDPPPPIGRLTGRLFGSYEVQRLIAAGGMGEVAHDDLRTRSASRRSLLKRP